LRSPSHDSDSRWLAIPFLTTLSFVTPCRFIPALTSLVGCSSVLAILGQLSSALLGHCQFFHQ
jgi:hypothetical protein